MASQLHMQHRNHCLSLYQSNNRWPSHGRSRPSTTRLRDFQGGQISSPNSSCMQFNGTWRPLVWSSTRALHHTIFANSAACLYPGRPWQKDTILPQCERGRWSESSAIYSPLPTRYHQVQSSVQGTRSLRKWKPLNTW